jgi:hypothetical protein
MRRILVTAGDAAGGQPSTVEITVVPFVIGREPDCDLVLDDPRASRRHAQLEVQPDGRVVLRDLGSSNGTFVDDTRVEDATWLSLPAVVRVGRTTLQVEAASAVAPAMDSAGSNETLLAAAVGGSPSALPDQGRSESNPAGRLESAAVAPVATAPAPAVPVAAASAPQAMPWGQPAPWVQAAPATSTQARRPAADPGSAPPAASAASTVAERPKPVTNAIVMLGLAGALSIGLGLLAIAIAGADEFDPELAWLLRLDGIIGVGLGAVQLVAALKIRLPVWRWWIVAVAAATIALSLALNALVATGLEGNVTILAFRIALNAGVLLGLVRFRNWYRRPATPTR